MDCIEQGAVQSNVSAPFNLEGQLNKAAMQKAINTILMRHQVLRSVYREENDECRQHVLEQFDATIPEKDLSHLSAEDFDEQVRVLARKEALTPFDLSSDVMLRVTLLKASEQKHTALFSMHHIASDGWSVGVFIREFNLLYSAFALGKENPLPTLEVQYSDYAHWQRDWMQGSVYEKELEYWRTQLQDAPPQHSLPLDKPRSTNSNIIGKKVKRTIPAPLLTKLNDFCKTEGVTLFMALQTIYSLTISKWSREDDVVMGTPIAGRMHQNVEPLIGFFLNNLVLRSNFAGNPTFKELMARNKKVLVDAFEHQNLPFDALVEEINPERSNTHQVMFQLWFVLQNHDSSDFTLPDLNMSLQECDEFIHFDLSLEAIEKQNQLEMNWLYQADIFNESTINELSLSFESLLESVLTNPNCHIDRLEVVAKDSAQPWLNKISNDYYKQRNLVTMIDQYSQFTPGANALVYQEKMLSYRKLSEQSNQLANYLVATGVTANSSVALCMERSPEMVIAMLGIMKAGASYIPMDPDIPRERIENILQDTGANTLVTMSSVAENFVNINTTNIFLDSEAWQASSTDALNIDIKSDDIAYILFTSGSTGRPKGVQVTHKNMINLAYSMQDILAERGLVGSFNWAWNAPLVFDASVQALTQLAFGVELHLLTEEMRTDPGALASYIESAEIDMLDTTPSLAELLVKECQSRDIELPSMLIGGEAMPTELWSTLAQYYEQHQSFALNVYGPTECTVNSTFADIEVNSKPNIGRGLPNVSLYVMNNAQQLLPVGAKGELYIGGEGVTAGYINNPELNAASFIDSDEFGRLYKSGDLVRWNHSGQLEFIGRSDFQIKLRGYRIELEEIENVALQHPIVDEVAVLVKDQQLVAYLVPDQAHESHIKSFLETRLPAYMVPSHIVMLAEMPVTANGKRDRKALLNIDVSTETTTYLPPETKMEFAVQAIWSELLGQDSISIDANFFDMGGHSLLAIKLVSNISRHLQQQFSIAQVFDAPTIRLMANCLTQASELALTGQVLTSPENDKSESPLSLSQSALSLTEQTLVKLRTGDAEFAPIFFVHPLGGQVFCYRELLQNIDSRIPIYAFQSTNMRHPSLEELSTHYLCLARQLTPMGQIHVIGWSMGGVIAQEMQRQAILAGDQQINIALIDSYPTPHDLNFTEQLVLITMMAEEMAIDLSALQLDSLHNLTISHALQLLKKTGVTQQRLPEDITEHDLAKHLAILTHNDQLFHQHKMQPSTGQGLLIAAGNNTQVAHWHRHIKQLTTARIAGSDHFSIVGASFSYHLAGHLQDMFYTPSSFTLAQ